MRPSRGRLSAVAVGGNNRAKPCFVRLEKVTSPKDDKDEEVHKKLTGPIKKRPVVMKRSPVGRPRKTAIDEDLSSYSLVTARSRRTPKPNPKYSKDHVMSTNLKSRDNRNSMYEDSDELPEPDDEDDDDDDDVDAEEDLALSTELDEQPSEEDDDDSSEDDKMRRRTVMRMRKSISPPPRKRGPGRPRTKFSPLERKPTPDSEKARALEVRRKKIEWEKPKSDVESSIIARNKRLNIELYDASDSDVPAISPTSRRGRPPAKTVASSSKTSDMILTRVQSKDITKKYGSNQSRSSAFQKERVANESTKQHSEDDDDVDMTTGAASTLDDFETMPTFTIVNINDIINKKGDVLTNKTPNEEDNSNANSQARNRRKSMHTTILSDKIDQSKLIPPPRSPFPPRKPTTSLNTLGANSLSKSLVSSSSSNDGFKSAPRILNSVVGKKTKPVMPVVSKLATKDRASEVSNFESLLGKQSKENVHVNTYGQASSAVRKLPNEKVLVQRQGNKLIKKITCFETWYVINIPPLEPTISKNILEMSLTELGNRSNEITLPSDLWNYKLTLQKMTETQLAKGNYQEFTGDLQDSNIPDAEKHKYQPVNIMFRRNNINPKLRMPFDRAVIFKSRTFFINMDGKNVRLSAAPETISSIDDVEAVLEIVDEIGIGHDLVEQQTFMQ